MPWNCTETFLSLMITADDLDYALRDTMKILAFFISWASVDCCNAKFLRTFQHYEMNRRSQPKNVQNWNTCTYKYIIWRVVTGVKVC